MTTQCRPRRCPHGGWCPAMPLLCHTLSRPLALLSPSGATATALETLRRFPHPTPHHPHPQPGREQLLSAHHHKQPVSLSLIGRRAGTQGPRGALASAEDAPEAAPGGCPAPGGPFLRDHASRFNAPPRWYSPAVPSRSAEGSAVVTLKGLFNLTAPRGLGLQPRSRDRHPHLTSWCPLQRQALEPRPEPAEQRSRCTCAFEVFVGGWERKQDLAGSP